MPLEGEAVVGLIASIITLVGAIKTICDATHDASGLPTEFREVHERLSFYQSFFSNCETAFKSRGGNGLDAHTENLFLQVKGHLQALQLIFDSVIAKTGASRKDRVVAMWSMVKPGAAATLKRHVDNINAIIALLNAAYALRDVPSASGMTTVTTSRTIANSSTTTPTRQPTHGRALPDPGHVAPVVQVIASALVPRQQHSVSRDPQRQQDQVQRYISPRQPHPVRIDTPRPVPGDTTPLMHSVQRDSTPLMHPHQRDNTPQQLSMRRDAPPLQRSIQSDTAAEQLPAPISGSNHLDPFNRDRDEMPECERMNFRFSFKGFRSKSLPNQESPNPPLVPDPAVSVRSRRNHSESIPPIMNPLMFAHSYDRFRYG